MAILCGPVTETISYVSKFICNHSVKIYDIEPRFEDIQIIIDDQLVPSAIGVSVALAPDFTTRATINLISKNVGVGTATISFAIESIEVPPPPPAEATHYLDLYLKPYSWYTPGGAADSIATKLGDINGAILNLFSSIGISDYKYIGTEVLTEADRPGSVTIRIKLKQLSVMSMAVPLLAYIVAIIASVLVIIIIIGVITGWKFTLAGVIEQITGKEYSKQDVVVIIEDKVIPEQIKKCREQFANDPAGLARCEKAVLSGAADGVTDALGLTGTDSATLGIDGKVDACLAQYNIDKNLNKYYSCLDKVAKDAGDETKAKTPKEGAGIVGTLILGTFILGGLYIISKGAEKVTVPVLVERERLRAEERARGG